MNPDRTKKVFQAAFLASGILAAVPQPSLAYIGPGAGFALVSSFLTFFIAFFTAFFAIFTLPVRMLVRNLKRKKIPGKPAAEKVIILGLDGLDPDICERLMDSGDLPSFARLRATGTFMRLGTSVPAMSPVAWSTFATGVDASRHAIFDFLSRNPRNYAPVLSSSLVRPGGRFLKVWRLRIPLQRGSVRLLRKSRSFWKILSEYGVFCSVLRVPITFPPEKINGVMLSGMCVPDLRGTMGSFSYFTTSEPDERTGGVALKLRKNGDKMEGRIPGPKSPFSEENLEVPIDIWIRREKSGAEIAVCGERFFLREGEYSPWVRLAFKAAPGVKLHCIARLYITHLDDPFGLYISPLHIDPEKPAMPISSPRFYSVYLSKRQGPFGTLGLSEDTWAVNERVLDEEAFLEQAYLFHRERERMFFGSLEKLRKGLCVCVFDLSDRLQHVFFRYLDETHPANRGRETAKHRDAVRDMYRQMDKLLSKTLDYVDEKTALFVISDHGFKSFKRGVNLNSWLRANGYLSTRGEDEGSEYLQNVDWSKTRAYAVGLGGIFVNLRGRERRGIVEASNFAALKEEISSKLYRLRDEASGGVVVRRVFDVERDFTGPYRSEGPDLIAGFSEGYRVSWDGARGKLTEAIIEDNEKSWSGDHCMDPESVPGVLFSNLEIASDGAGLIDMAPTVLKLFGLDKPGYMVGKALI